MMLFRHPCRTVQAPPFQHRPSFVFTEPDTVLPPDADAVGGRDCPLRCLEKEVVSCGQFHYGAKRGETPVMAQGSFA